MKITNKSRFDKSTTNELSHTSWLAVGIQVATDLDCRLIIEYYSWVFWDWQYCFLSMGLRLGMGIIGVGQVVWLRMVETVLQLNTENI